MTSRWSKAGRKAESMSANRGTSIERLRKMRVLNCSPSDIGLDSSVMRKFESHKANGLLRLV